MKGKKGGYIIKKIIVTRGQKAVNIGRRKKVLNRGLWPNYVGSPE
jgi:hypothetical protein